MTININKVEMQIIYVVISMRLTLDLKFTYMEKKVIAISMILMLMSMV